MPGNGITLTSACLPFWPATRNEAARISPGAASCQPDGTLYLSVGEPVPEETSGWPCGSAAGNAGFLCLGHPINLNVIAPASRKDPNA